MTEPSYHIQPTDDWRTERFDELSPQDLIGLIGKTVHIGVYTNADELSIAITGTVHVVLDETHTIGRVSVEFQTTTDTPPNIKWSTENYYAILTWNAA